MIKKAFQILVLLLFGTGLTVAVLRMPRLDTSTHHANNNSTSVKEADAPTDYSDFTEQDLLVLAYDGDKEAAYRLGVLYDYGDHQVEQSFAKALSWYETADAANYPLAACALGYLHMNGCGVSVDYDVAAQYFERAVAFGDKNGYVGLGRIALEDADRAEEARADFMAAYDAGIADGAYFLGYMAEKGIGQEVDYAYALLQYQAVVDAYANEEDAYAYHNALTRLGICYLKGYGTDVDLVAARSYLETAAQDGYAMAEYYMGIIYESGIGVSIDYDEALTWLEKAAESNYAPALNQIGYMYFMGEGVEVNYEQAVYYQKLAAALGSKEAQANLGYLYENGYGVEQNYDTALSYYRMAADNGYEGAAEALLRVTSMMDALAVGETAADGEGETP